jgi:hypothetical protein
MAQAQPETGARRSATRSDIYRLAGRRAGYCSQYQVHRRRVEHVAGFGNRVVAESRTVPAYRGRVALAAEDLRRVDGLAFVRTAAMTWDGRRGAVPRGPLWMWDHWHPRWTPRRRAQPGARPMGRGHTSSPRGRQRAPSPTGLLNGGCTLGPGRHLRPPRRPGRRAGATPRRERGPGQPAWPRCSDASASSG